MSVGPLIVGVAGAAFGNAVLGAGIAGISGATIGWAVGSTVGSALFGPDLPDIQGPRLGDTTVPYASYGHPIPHVHGTMSVTAGLIWSAGRQEHKHEEDVGGKGAPSQTRVLYTYTASFQVLACVRVDQIRRIWADTTLIADMSDTASVEGILATQGGGLLQLQDQIADNVAAASVRVYLGAEDQEPDPLIESYEGAGSVPAHRGYVTLVFEDLELGDYGRRIPTITLECAESGSEASVPRQLDTFNLNEGVGNKETVTYAADGVFYTLEARVYSEGSSSSKTMLPIYRKRDYTGNVVAYHQGRFEHHDAREYIDVFPVQNAVEKLLDVQSANVCLVHGSSKTCFEKGDVDELGGAAELGGFVYVAVRYSTDYKWRIASAADRFPELLQFTGEISHVTAYNGHLWVRTAQNTIHKVDADTWTIVQTFTISDTGTNWRAQFAIHGNRVVYNHSPQAGGSWHIYVDQLNDDGTTTNLGTDDYGVSGLQVMDLGAGLCYINSRLYHFGQSVSAGTVSLDTVVSEICDEAGLSASDYDVSALSGITVKGYTRTRQASARSFLQQLQRAYFWDFPMRDYQLTAVLRGQDPVATIPADDFGAHLYGSDKPDLLPVTRADDVQLPRRLWVDYIAEGTDYERGSQHSERLITESVNEASVELPLVLSDDEAAQIAEVLHYNAWLERHRYPEFYVPYSDYKGLDAGDVIQATLDGITHVVRITEVAVGQGIMKCRGVAERKALYTSNAAGAATHSNPSTISLAGPTELVLLDIPMLDEAHTDAGVYVAAGGYLSGWPGAVVYKSSDDVTWAQATAITDAAAIGNVIEALPSGPTTVWDDGNSLRVYMPDTVNMTSATDAEVLNWANVLAVGDHGRWELVQFGNATQESDGSWTLTRLLRGRRGTEWAVDAHTTGDTVVVLSQALARVLMATGEAGADRYYRGVTLGKAVESATSQAYAVAFASLKPWSPVHIQGSRDGSDNLTITWVRRARYQNEWRDNTGVPVVEETEAYEVDILDGPGNVVRTITGLSSQSTTYSAADQTTDFGSPQSAVDVKVYQISATIGRGYAGEATV